MTYSCRMFEAPIPASGASPESYRSSAEASVSTVQSWSPLVACLGMTELQWAPCFVEDYPLPVDFEHFGRSSSRHCHCYLPTPPAPKQQKLRSTCHKLRSGIDHLPRNLKDRYSRITGHEMVLAPSFTVTNSAGSRAQTSVQSHLPYMMSQQKARANGTSTSHLEGSGHVFSDIQIPAHASIDPRLPTALISPSTSTIQTPLAHASAEIPNGAMAGVVQEASIVGQKKLRDHTASAAQTISKLQADINSQCSLTSNTPSLQQPAAGVKGSDASDATVFSSISPRPFTLSAIPQRKRKASLAAQPEVVTVIKCPRMGVATMEATAARLNHQHGKCRNSAIAPNQPKFVQNQRVPALAATHPSQYNNSSAITTDIDCKALLAPISQYPVLHLKHAIDPASIGDGPGSRAQDDKAAIIAASDIAPRKTVFGFLVNTAPELSTNVRVRSPDSAPHVYRQAVIPTPTADMAQIPEHEKRRDSVGSYTAAPPAQQPFIYGAYGWSPSRQCWVDPTHHTSTKPAGATKPIVGYPLARDGTVSSHGGTLSVMRMIQLPFGSVTELGCMYREAQRRARDEA